MRDPWEDALRVLSNRTRYRLLVGLLERGRRRSGIALEDVFRGELDRDAVRTALYHNHLPKLQESGYVRWDEERSAVRRGPRFEEIEPLLELLYDRRDELPGAFRPEPGRPR